MANQDEKEMALDKAIEITKEFARGEATGDPADLLERAYKKLIVLIDDSKKTSYPISFNKASVTSLS